MPPPKIVGNDGLELPEDEDEETQEDDNVSIITLNQSSTPLMIY